MSGSRNLANQRCFSPVELISVSVFPITRKEIQNTEENICSRKYDARPTNLICMKASEVVTGIFFFFFFFFLFVHQVLVMVVEEQSKKG